MCNAKLWFGLASLLAVGLALMTAGRTEVQVRAAASGSLAATPASVVLPSPVSGATRDPSLAIDASGRRHVAFSVGLSGEVIYATCAANCSNAANWTSVQVGANDVLGGRPLIALTPDGRPRLMYVREGSSTATPSVLIYNACESNCTSAANWTELAVLSGVGRVDTPFFALDPQGRPRAVIRTDALVYLACDGDCATSASNWSSTLLPAFTGFGPTLAIDAAGNPHLLYKMQRQGNDVLVYAGCSQSCTDEANWFGGEIFPLGVDFLVSYTIATDSANRPRIAFFTGNLATSDPAANALAYAWCDSACETADNWGGVLVGTPQNEGVAPDLALDGADRPHISYYNDASGFELGYATCTANCESATGSWTTERVESPLGYPSQLAPGCLLSSWYVTGPTALAFSPAGVPQIAFVARNVQTCSTVTSERLRQVRFIDLGQSTLPEPSPTPIPPGSYRAYLPLARR